MASKEYIDLTDLALFKELSEQDLEGLVEDSTEAEPTSSIEALFSNDDSNEP